MPGLPPSVGRFSSASSIFKLFAGVKVQAGSAVLSSSAVREALRARSRALGVPIGSVNEDLNTLELFLDAATGDHLPGEEDSSASEASTIPAPAPPTPSKRAFPGRRPYGRGSDKDLDDVHRDADLLNELDVDKFSGAGAVLSGSIGRESAQRRVHSSRSPSRPPSSRLPQPCSGREATGTENVQETAVQDLMHVVGAVRQHFTGFPCAENVHETVVELQNGCVAIIAFVFITSCEPRTCTRLPFRS